MSIDVNWFDPYEDRRGTWRRGQLHAHTSPTSECAELAASDVLESYTRAGLDFLALSDHMALTLSQNAGLTCIPGLEWHSPIGEHTGIYGLDEDLLRSTIENTDHQLLLNLLRRQDVLVILNHPNWGLTGHYSREDLDSIAFYDGIEVFNAMIDRLAGQAMATNKWDYLLSRGRRVLGFVGDDSHSGSDIGRAWLGVRSPSSSAEDILTAIRSGNFYGSSGVGVRDIRRNGGVIEMETDNAAEIQVIGNGGSVIERVADNSIAYRATGREIYVRLTAYGPGSAMAWSQPFFV